MLFALSIAQSIAIFYLSCRSAEVTSYQYFVIEKLISTIEYQETVIHNQARMINECESK
jgi:hypothetical protein